MTSFEIHVIDDHLHMIGNNLLVLGTVSEHKNSLLF